MSAPRLACVVLRAPLLLCGRVYEKGERVGLSADLAETLCHKGRATKSLDGMTA